MSEALAKRVNRGKGRRQATLRFVGEDPFGPRLRTRSWRFANGLRVVTLPDDSAPVVSYQTWLGVGSRHEEPGKTGLAHFFEHLMFGETKHAAHGEFDRRLEEVGAESNAATWTDWTCFYENLPARELPLAIELEADRLQNLVLDGPRVESEREVVMSERRDRIDDDVDGRAGESLWATAFKKHPYRHPTLGWMRDIRRLSVADCERFYRTWYAPNNAVIAIAGKFDEVDALRRIRDAYGAMRRSRLPAEPPLAEPRQRRERRKLLRLPASTQKLHIGYHAPAFTDPDWIALTVLSQHLVGAEASRLHQELVMDRELAQSVWGYLPPFALPSLFELGIDLRPGRDAGDALDALDAAIARVVAEGVEEDALQRAKARLELGLVSSMETAGGKGDLIGFYTTLGLRPGGIFDRIEATAATTSADLQRVARRWLDPRQRTVITVVPR